MILDGSIREFARALASKEPVPGGGAAAACVGALAAAAASMAMEYSREDGDDFGEAMARMARIREALLDLTEMDRRAYKAYLMARKLPKGTAEEKAHRRAELEKTLERALQVPLDSASLCLEGLRCLHGASSQIRPRIATDAGVSALFFRAALRGCWYNVHVNSLALKDREKAAALARQREAEEAEAETLERAVDDQVKRFLEI